MSNAHVTASLDADFGMGGVVRASAVTMMFAMMITTRMRDG